MPDRVVPLERDGELGALWDKNIKPYEPIYGAFMAQMHRFAVRLRDEAPLDARNDVGAYLSRLLEYPVRKPLAKFIDEHNWYAAFGATRARP